MKTSLACTRAVCAAVSAFLMCAPARSQTAVPDVVVTASRTEQILTDVLPHTTVLGRDAIEQSQLQDVPSLLAREAGFQFTQNGGPGMQATTYLRGAASMQLLVLVDGLPMTKQDTTGAVSLEHLMLDQIERIEIVRGNVSAVYGSGAIGGVIQIFTRQPKGPPSAYASAEIGSRKTQRFQLGTQGKLGDFGYAVSLGQTSTDGISAANAAQTTHANPDADGYRNRNHNVHLSYDLGPDHKWGLRSTVFNGRFDYDVAGSYVLPTDTHRGTARIENNTVYWSARFLPAWSSRLNYSEGTERNTTATVGAYSFTTQAQTRTRILSWTHQYKLDALILSAGLDHQTQGIDMATDHVSGLSRQRKANALYAGAVYTQGSHSAQLNVRRDQVQDVGGKNSVYLGYGYELNPQWKLMASYATAFNVPPLGYLYDPYSGNPNLRPESAKTKEIGVQWAHAGQRLRATWFDTRTSDLLLYDFDNWRFSNISSAKNRGLETSYSARLASTDLRASLTLQDPINEATGQQLPRRAKTLVSLSAAQRWDQLSLGAHMRYVGARPDLDGNPRLSSAVLLDLTARYALTPHWTLSGRIENATNSNYQSAHGYNQLPRTFYVGLNWKMKP